MIRLALVGCTSAVDKYSSIAARIRNASITATVDPDLELARCAAARLGAANSATGLAELLSAHAATVDAVLIHSETRSRAAEAICAAQAGKHVLIEPPLALAIEDCERVLAAAQKSQVCLMPGQCDRFQPALQAAHQKIAAGKIGSVALVRIHRWEGRRTADWHAWRQDAERSGGTLLSEVTRDIDLVCWLLDRQPTNVYAVARNPGNLADADSDYAQLHLGFPEGGMALIVYCRSLPAGDGYFSLSAVGSQGAIYADDHHNMQLLYRGGAPRALKTESGHHHFLAQLQEFVDTVTEGRRAVIPATAGQASLRVALAAVESLEDGAAVALDQA